MVALLVLLTFVTFIAIDYALNREKYQFKEAKVPAPAPVGQRVFEPVVAGIRMPEQLAYHTGHTWAMDLGEGRIRIGVDEFGSSLLGTIAKLELPQRGRWLRQGDKGITVTTDRGTATLLSPVEGEIIRVNDAISNSPEAVSKDPYGKGWLLELFSPDAAVSFRNLLSGATALKWMEEQMDELRMAFAPQLVTSQDGGLIHSKLGDELPPEVWREQVKRFFKI